MLVAVHCADVVGETFGAFSARAVKHVFILNGGPLLLKVAQTHTDHRLPRLVTSSKSCRRRSDLKQSSLKSSRIA